MNVPNVSFPIKATLLEDAKIKGFHALK